MPTGVSWTPEEDQSLRRLVEEFGPKRWSLISQNLKTKGSKQCRRRWKNYLNADIKKGGWGPEEDAILIRGHAKYGNKWTEIAKMVTGRTDNAVKNRWMAICKKGAEPVPGLASDNEEDTPEPKAQPPAPTHHHGTRHSSRRAAGRPEAPPGYSLDPGMATTPPGSRRGPPPGLNVSIPHAAGDAPNSGGLQTYDAGPLSIRVVKDMLDSTELALLQEVNNMGMPLSIHVQEKPIPLQPGPQPPNPFQAQTLQPGQPARNTPPQATGPDSFKQAQEAMGSPSSDQFSIDELLKYFTGTPTPRQAAHQTRFAQRRDTRSLGAGGASGGSPAAPTPGALLEPHRQLLHKIIQRGMQLTPRGLPPAHPQPAGGSASAQRLNVNSDTGQPGPLTASLATPGVTTAAQDLMLDDIGDAVDVLLSPSFGNDDISALLEALEGGDPNSGGFHTGFTPRGGSGFTPRAKRPKLG